MKDMPVNKLMIQMGIPMIWWAFPITEIISCLVGYMFLKKIRKNAGKHWKIVYLYLWYTFNWCDCIAYSGAQLCVWRSFCYDLLCLTGIFKRNIQSCHFSIKTGYCFTSTCINPGQDDGNQWNIHFICLQYQFFVTNVTISDIIKHINENDFCRSKKKSEAGEQFEYIHIYINCSLFFFLKTK